MKALRKDFIREIRHTLSRFLSILILVALAVAFLSGLRSTAPDMKNTCDQYLDQQSFMDIQILGTLGITQEDIDLLRAQPGIEAVEPAYVIDAYAHDGAVDVVTKLYSLPRQLNQVTVLEGRMPAAPDECVVDSLLYNRMDLSLDSNLEFQTSGDFEEALLPERFQVVGVVRSPLYISPERGTSTLGTGQVGAFAYVPEEAFNLDFFTTAYLTVEGASQLQAFSPAYTEQMDSMLDRLDPFGKERAKLRRQSLVDEGNEKLADAEAELAEAKADAEKELTDAWNELQDARRELDDGWAELKDAQETLATETADAEQKIADAQVDLQDAFTKLTDGETEYQDGLAEYEDGLAQYEDGLEEFEENKEKLADGWEEYYDGRREYNTGVSELNANRALLEQGQKQYDDGKKQFGQLFQGFIGPAFARYPGLSSIDTADKLLNTLKTEAEAAAAPDADPAAKAKPVHTALNGILTDLKEVQLPNLNAAAAGLKKLGESAASVSAQIPTLRQAVAALPDETPEETQEKAELSAALDDAETKLNALKASGLPMGGDPVPVLAAAEGESSESPTPSLATTIGGLSSAVDQIQTNYTHIITAAQAGDSSLSTAPAIIETASQIAAIPPMDADSLRIQLVDGKATLDNGWAQLRQGEAQLDSARWQLAEARSELNDAQEQLDDAEEELEDAKKELDDAKLQLEDARTELDDGWQEYYDGEIELDDARIELKDKVAEAKVEIADARRELRDGEGEYADGLAEYNDGKAEAEEKIADAEDKIGDARRKIADIGDSEWYILDRDTNPGYLGFGQDADRMANLASVFPLLFFLVAALVCLTTMTRMVDEQRVQIGSLKALGYSRWAISRKYLGYGFLPSLLGGILGLAIGFTLFPKMIFTAYQIMYEVPDIQLSVYPGISALSLAAAIGCTTVSSLAACLNALRETPAALMRPRAPKAGKRVLLEYIKPLWSRMSFNHKVTARNLLRYQKRFWMTVIGIGGCTALIIAGFGLRSSLLATMSIQYDEIFNYTAQVATSENLLPSEREAIQSYISSNGDILDTLPCRIGNVTAESDTYNTSAYMEVVDPHRINDFVDLRTYRHQEPITVPEDGVVIDQKLSELLDIGPGDTFVIDGDKRVEVQVAAVNENYLAHFIYLSPDYYEEVFGEPLLNNAYLMEFSDDNLELCDSIFTDLMELHGVVSASRMLSTRDTYMSAMERIDFVVVIVILSAAALALVVLYNLSNINITERRRELATIRVLGFYDREVSAYVNRENTVLTLFGILFGIGAGRLLHNWLVRSVEIDLMMFGRETDPKAYLWAAILTTVFSAVVAWMSHLKMKGIDMVESLKSAE